VISGAVAPATVLKLLSNGPDNAPAIRAPGRPPLTYAGLRTLAARTREKLNSMGIGAGDRVAIVLPNGPEMASAFVSISCAAATAPLNPAYRLEDFEFSFGDLRPRALVVLEGVDTPARRAAMAADIAIIELIPGTSAGDFTLRIPERQGEPSCLREWAGPDDVALLLHTSGTTSRPKLVPLSNANVAASAYNISVVLALGPDDCCLNIMPLFHIHGLIAAVLASLLAGGSVCCTAGFNAFRFFNIMESERPTWLTAVPTMYQSLLGLAERNRAVIERGRLRLIRSSSASLPPRVMVELEQIFKVPVIESYGMTEAAHQMASNPLPPRPRIPGSVGISAGPEISILSVNGELLARGEVGEVAIRGDNVMAGYDANPLVNASAFTNGWFRTGDEGYLDPDGYLHLTGRLKEVINRGGEKISPLEVDLVILEHPAVSQALTFAAPHPLFGEEVATAVVLKMDANVTEMDLRQFAAERLAAFKVPTRVVFVAEIPKGNTGKPQRIGLARKLGLT
jgi:acyl-CoA synthetase (AMP-forming)/AMP-acid ligase II